MELLSKGVRTAFASLQFLTCYANETEAATDNWVLFIPAASSVRVKQNRVWLGSRITDEWQRKRRLKYYFKVRKREREIGSERELHQARHNRIRFSKSVF